MPVSGFFSEGFLYAFLLVFARVTGAFVLVPLPGMQTGTEIARVTGSLAITVALMPSWPHYDSFPDSIAAVFVAVLIEAVFGLSIGLAVSCMTEMLMIAAQVISQQAGFSFASMVDPSTNADSGVLLVVGRLTGSLLFLALGLDREVIRIFAESLAAHPPGFFQPDPRLAQTLWRFAAGIFSVGVRLAMPAIALLGLIDISLALLGRINQQLHLISIAFPVKIFASLAIIAVLAALYPRAMEAQAGYMVSISRHAAGLDNHGR